MVPQSGPCFQRENEGCHHHPQSRDPQSLVDGSDWSSPHLQTAFMQCLPSIVPFGQGQIDKRGQVEGKSVLENTSAILAWDEFVIHQLLVPELLQQ